MRRRATIDDVAALAAVSIKTVSRVMNREPNVRAATREAVLDAARKLRYRPNHSARGLAGGRSFLIGLVYDNPSDSYVVNVQGGALEAVRESGYELVLHPCNSSDRRLASEILELVSRSRLDGMILTPPVSEHEGVYRALARNATPFACIAPRRAGRGLAVTLDDRAAAQELVDHIAGLGHRRIAIVTGPKTHVSSHLRYTGYRDALLAHGLLPDPELVFTGAYTFESGLAAAEYLLGLAKPPSAVFACNDDMAAGALHKALQRGLQVPRQLSIAGFDDMRIASQVWPSLTTVRQPAADMGRRAVQLLVNAIAGGEKRALRQVDYTLMLRDSVCACPQEPSIDH
jgi:LacI family transcriptional regulator